MNLPPLNKSDRRREYDLYPEDVRDAVVYHYLFSSFSHRELDEKIMCLNETITGYQSMNILHFLGLSSDFKGVFAGYSIETAIEELLSSHNDDYSEIVNCLSRYNETSNTGYEDKEDYRLIVQINDSFTNPSDSKPFKHKGVKKAKAAPVLISGKKVFPRDRKTAFNALSHAHYSCEVDNTHPTFIRRSTNYAYTEPHHLIPLAFSDEFDVSLDVEENIVSLCSNCHNQLHYGKEIDTILKTLYNQRYAALKKVGLEITFERLKSFYY